MQPPEVEVTAPNGSEVWDIGSNQTITWTATDNIGVVSVSIILSSDGGLTYPDTLATGEANDGEYPWDITQDATTTARIKVIAYDDAGNNGEDIGDGDFALYDPASGIDITRDIPTDVVIMGNSPNPFGKITEIRFGIPTDGRVQLAVYDVNGKVVALLLEESIPAGYHSVIWRSSTPLGMGLYFVRLRSGTKVVTHKVVLSQ